MLNHENTWDIVFSFNRPLRQSFGHRFRLSMVKSRLTIVELCHLSTWIRGGMNSKRNESMRNVTTIRVFYLYRYVHVITYECRGRNAGNNNVISRTRSRFSFYRSSYRDSIRYLWYRTCNERTISLLQGYMQQLLYDYWRLIAFARPSHRSLTTDSRETRNVYAFPSRLQPTRVRRCDCWPDLCACKAIYGNVTNCYKPYRLTMLSDHLINLVG